MVELQPSKLGMRVRFPFPAPQNLQAGRGVSPAPSFFGTDLGTVMYAQEESSRRSSKNSQAYPGNVGAVFVPPRQPKNGSRGTRFGEWPARRVCSHAWVGWRPPARWLPMREAPWRTSRSLIS